MNNQPRIFIGGRLHKTRKDLMNTYELIDGICHSSDFATYLPHRDSRNYIKEKYQTPQERAMHLLEVDIRGLLSCQHGIMVLNAPSHGVGIELEIARNNDKDLIGLAHPRTIVSPNCIGIGSAVKKIFRYTGDEDLERLLPPILKELRKDPNFLKKTYSPEEIYREWFTKAQKESYSWMHE
jgi:hypothetical protein